MYQFGIAIPTIGGRQRYLEKLIRDLSTDIQAHNAHLYVLDFASKDGTGAFLDQLSEELPNLSVIHYLTRYPHYRGYNLAIQAVDAEYVWLCPDDDVIPNGAIRTVAGLLKIHGDHDVILGNCEAIDNNGLLLNQILYFNEQESLTSPQGLKLAPHYRIAMPAAIIRKSQCEKYAYYSETTGSTADLAFWLSHTAIGKTLLTPSILGQLRYHTEAVTCQKGLQDSWHDSIQENAQLFVNFCLTHNLLFEKELNYIAQYLVGNQILGWATVGIQTGDLIATERLLNRYQMMPMNELEE